MPSSECDGHGHMVVVTSDGGNVPDTKPLYLALEKFCVNRKGSCKKQFCRDFRDSPELKFWMESNSPKKLCNDEGVRVCESKLSGCNAKKKNEVKDSFDFTPNLEETTRCECNDGWEEDWSATEPNCRLRSRQCLVRKRKLRDACVVTRKRFPPAVPPAKGPAFTTIAVESSDASVDFDGDDGGTCK